MFTQVNTTSAKQKTLYEANCMYLLNKQRMAYQTERERNI